MRRIFVGSHSKLVANKEFLLSKSPPKRFDTLPETNSHSTWKCMVGIRLLPFGFFGLFSGALAVKKKRSPKLLAYFSGRVSNKNAPRNFWKRNPLETTPIRSTMDDSHPGVTHNWIPNAKAPKSLGSSTLQLVLKRSSYIEKGIKTYKHIDVSK